MKGKGYIIGMLLGIPLFIIIVNFLFFRGNNPTKEQVNKYITNTIIDTIQVPKDNVYEKKQYIKGISRRGRPSGFMLRYLFYSLKYQKHFSVITFMGFERNRRFPIFLSGPLIITARINKTQLANPLYGTKEQPLPVFAINLIESEYAGSEKDAKKIFNVSDTVNFQFVEQYLKHFMPKKEFKTTFKK